MRAADRLLAGLDDDQRAAVTSPDLPLAIIAGPGSGKTRVLTTRVAWRIAVGDTDPARTLVVTFTRRAAGELGGRLTELGVRGTRVGTLHSFAAATLQGVWRDSGEPVRGMVRFPLRMLSAIVQSWEGSAPLPDARAVAAELSWAKARAVSADGYLEAALRAGRLPGWDEASLRGVGAAYAEYEREKAKRRLIDVDDLIPALTARVATDDELAQRLRWAHQHLYVDEFQDLGRAAFRLIRSLIGVSGDLTVVGDPDQAVYGFAGSDPRLLVRLPEALAGTSVVRLRRSYRCPPGALAAALFVRGDEVPDPADVRSRCRRSVTDRAVVTGSGHDSEADEAHAVAWALRCEHASGRPWSQLAVLARTNARLDAITSACESSGVPVRSRRCLLDRPEVKSVLDALLARPGSVPALAARSLLKRVAAEALDNPDLMGPARRALTSLVALADEYVETVGGGTQDGLLAWLDGTVRARGGEPAEAGDAVDVLTFHRAKGLEWDVVHLVGVEAGLVPLSADDDDEERRLLYVALTRGREAVECSWVGEPSRWLPAALDIAGAYALQPAPPPAELSALRHRLVPQSDPALTVLRRWRSAAARAAGIPPAAVLTDAVLERVARARPRSVHDLAAVPGVGPMRAAALGAALLAALATAA